MPECWLRRPLRSCLSLTFFLSTAVTNDLEMQFSSDTHTVADWVNVCWTLADISIYFKPHMEHEAIHISSTNAQRLNHSQLIESHLRATAAASWTMSPFNLVCAISYWYSLVFFPLHHSASPYDKEPITSHSATTIKFQRNNFEWLHQTQFCIQRTQITSVPTNKTAQPEDTWCWLFLKF